MKTLEMITKGQVLQRLTDFTSYRVTKSLWKTASKSFVKGAKGGINFFTTISGPYPTSIGSTVEEQILDNNDINVITHIVS